MTRPAAVLVAVWFGLSVANAHSVARFRPVTVAALTAALVVLVAVLLATRRRSVAAASRVVVAAALVGVAVGVETVRYFSYLPPGVRTLSAHLVAATALATAALWAFGGRRAHDAALWLGGACVAATTYLAVRYDPVPRIDVWYSLDQAAAGLAAGRNPYELTWYGAPGVADAFTYLPMTAVLLAPFRWLLGDVRWGLTAALLLAGWLLTRLGARRLGGDDPRGVALLLWLTPGQLVQTEQGWTEPLLLCLLVAMLWCAQVGAGRAAVAVLAVTLATKQHAALLLPALALWRPVGARRVLAAGVGAAALCLPFLLWNPAAFLRDTVTLLLDYPPLRLSPNLYLAAYRSGWTPPFALTALVVLVALAGTAAAVRREQPSAARLALWWAVLLLVVNLVNKQAFYNQFWLVGSLVLVAAGGWGEPARQDDRQHAPAGRHLREGGAPRGGLA